MRRAAWCGSIRAPTRRRRTDPMFPVPTYWIRPHRGPGGGRGNAPLPVGHAVHAAARRRRARRTADRGDRARHGTGSEFDLGGAGPVHGEADGGWEELLAAVDPEDGPTGEDAARTACSSSSRFRSSSTTTRSRWARALEQIRGRHGASLGPLEAQVAGDRRRGGRRRTRRRTGCSAGGSGHLEQRRSARWAG